MPQIKLPHNYDPRWYQLPFLQSMDAGKRYAALVWARRHGKDLTCWNYAIKRAAQEPMSVTYAYPTVPMGRKNLWKAKTNDGQAFTSFIPLELRRRRTRSDDGLNDSRMEVELFNGSIINVVSTTDPDSLRGANSKLYVLSEFAEMDPQVLDVIEPVVEANGGQVVINFTPKGDNHARGAWENWVNDSDWYTSMIKATDTDVFKSDQLEKIKERLIGRYVANGRSEEEAIAFFEQEYFCSFDAPVVGSYYGAAIKKAEEDGRITNVPWNPMLPVNTYWDLGIGDSTAIWFEQTVGNEIHIIDYYEMSGVGLAHYAKNLREKPYTYGRHVAPHDIEARELGTGKSRKEIAASLGIFFETAAKLPVDDGIDAARTLIPQCWFDKTKCDRGVKVLKNYHKKYDEEKQIYSLKPEHDWSSHGADAFRTMGVSYHRPETWSRQDLPSYQPMDSKIGI